MIGLRSIRWQLQAWHGLLLAVILGGLGLTAYHFERVHQMERLDEQLRSLSALLSNASRPGRPAGGTPRNPRGERELKVPDQVAPLFAKGGGYYYAIWLKNGPDYTASAAAPADLPRPAEDTSGVRSRNDFREGFISPAPGDTYLVGTTQGSIDNRLRTVAAMLVAVGVAIWAVAMLVGAWFIGRSLRPIEAISSTAARITEGDLSQRIDTKETESELGVLAATLNATFARLDAVFGRQSRFTADAAHELRTPITVLLTHIQNTLDSGDLSDDNREALEACQRAAQRMRRLIESLLQLARFDAGSELLEAKPCDLAAIARECMELTMPLAKARHIAFVADLLEAKVFGDRDRLSQVLVNLLGNAIHYNHENGEVRLSVRVEGEKAVCTVTNTGPGISPGHLPHVFERFFRADQARTMSGGRSGLGLAISKAIVVAHGGEISVESPPGGVTKFTVRLPVSGGA